MRNAVRQLSTAARSLFRQPSVTLPAVLTLALGIGANTALFTYLAAVVWPRIEAPEPERVGWVYAAKPDEPRTLASWPEYLDLRDHQKAVAGLVAWSRFGASVAAGEQSTFGWGHLVSGNYFSLFGAVPSQGRLIQPADDRAGAPPVAVLGYRFWHDTLGGDPHAVGREMRVNGIGLTVVGVGPKGFEGAGLASAIYVPVALSDRVTGTSRLADRGNRWLVLLGRRARGVSVAQAQAALDGLGKALDASTPLEDGKPRRMDFFPATHNDPEQGDEPFVRAARILMAVATLFLLLACASIANLLLARAISRQREWGIRASLGASRARLIQGVLAESLVLCLAGGAAGMVVTALLQKRLEDYLSIAPGGLGNWAEGTDFLRFDLRAVAFGFLVTLACALLGALGPVLKVVRGDLLQPLKSDASASGTGGGLGPRQLLVVAQVALSVLLLLGGGLLVRTLASARSLDAGFDPDGLLLATVNIPRNVMQKEDSQLYRRVLDAIRGVPGVASASLCQVTPLGGWSRDLGAASAERPDQVVEMTENSVAADFFATLGVPVLAGRPLDDRDREGTAPVVVVSRALAQKLWGEVNVVGRTLVTTSPFKDKTERFEVVGVAQDVRSGRVLEPPGPAVYFSSGQKTHPRMTIVARVARTRASPDAMASVARAIRTALRRAHPDLAIVEMMSGREQLLRAIFPQRMYAEVAVLFAVLGLAVAVVGLFGLQSYSVTLRLRELGIRMAVGAAPKDVQRLVVRQGMMLVAAGAVVGVAGALALSRLLSSMLFGIRATDPVTFVAVPAVLAVVALVACWLPARRAARLDPTIALKGA